MQNLSRNGYVTIQALKAADNENIAGSGVDMLGYDSVEFITGCLKGEELTVTVKAQQDTDSAFGTAADLEGTSDTFTTDLYTDGLAILDIHKPQERYVRPYIAMPNADAAKSLFCIAIQYNPKYRPITQDGEHEVHASPDEGTA